MKTKLFTILVAVMVSFSLLSTEAFAKRMGGGGSSGMHRSIAPAKPAKPAAQKQTDASKQAQQPAAAGTAAGAASKGSLMGPLMGLAAGGLLAAAFMGGAFDGISPMDIIVLLLIIGAVVFFLRRRAQQSATASASPMPAGAAPMPNAMRNPNQFRQAESQSGFGNSNQIEIGSLVADSTVEDFISKTNYPSWFEAEKFEKQAQTWYIALQSAWDNQDWNTLSALSTADYFTELKAQRLAEADNNTTRVDEVKAEVRDMVKENGQWVLTVQFMGYVSEQDGHFAHAFNEYWHLVRIGEAEGEWKLAGIQQA